MSVNWIQRHINVPDGTTRVVIPGYCNGDVEELSERVGVGVERGPRDLRQLAGFPGLGSGSSDNVDHELTAFSIEILAEINHAPRLSRAEILELARHYADNGADVIDIGCEPGDPWSGVGECVRALCDQGYRISIDSLQTAEIEPAVRAGAELVLSVDSSNRDAARDWGCEVVVIPDSPRIMDSLDETVAFLASHNVPLRIDPILEPIGLGIAASLRRYMDVRRRYPEHAMMMGIGNLTEMTDVDSAGLNVLLIGICQELGIRSLLTTEVINWARTSVRECDWARRLAHCAVHNRVPAKHLTTELLLLRDEKLRPFGDEQLDQIASQITDSNYRILAERGQLHALCAGSRLADTDPFALFEKLFSEAPKGISASQSFYLGFEMCKAAIALNLGKEYRQDESLDWGYLTVEEQWHRLKRG